MYLLHEMMNCRTFWVFFFCSRTRFGILICDLPYKQCLGCFQACTRSTGCLNASSLAGYASDTRGKYSTMPTAVCLQEQFASVFLTLCSFSANFSNICMNPYAKQANPSFFGYKFCSGVSLYTSLTHTYGMADSVLSAEENQRLRIPSVLANIPLSQQSILNTFTR